MSDPLSTHRIWDPAKRLQHLLYGLAFTLSFLSGAALPGGSRLLTRAAAAMFGGLGTIFWWHAFFGLLSAAAIAGHLLYLGVRGYIESLPWKIFPLRFGRGDIRALVGELSASLRGLPPAPVRYTAQRRAFYWMFLVGGLAAPASGFALRYWDWLDSAPVTASLGFLGALHGGMSFILALLVLWHIYDLLDGGRRLPLLGVMLTGVISDDRLREYYPDEHRRISEARQKVEQALLQKDREGQEEKHRSEERSLIELLLEEGNRLAREGRHLDAADRYRDALKQFPGYSQGQYNLALVLERAGLPEEALNEYERFLAVDPFHPLAETVRKSIQRLRG
jgi:tetratricopeptide (TPR) repeat protein